MTRSSITTMNTHARLKCVQHDRREACKVMLASAFSVTGLTSSPINTWAASNRPKGSAELDFEYYFKDLLTGNALDPSMERPTQLPPARTLDRALAVGFLNVAVNKIVEYTNNTVNLDDVNRKIEELRFRVEPSFQKKSSFPSNDVSNQYNFDMMSYITYRIAGTLITDIRQRSLFLKSVGVDCLDLCLGRIPQEKWPPIYDARKEGIGRAIKGVNILLSYFESTGFLKGYSFSPDEFIEDDWADGSSVSLQIDVSDPATIGSLVQASGEGSRFHAEYIGNMITEYLRRCCIQSTFEEYPLDAVYRPNPNEFVATNVIYQFELDRV